MWVWHDVTHIADTQSVQIQASALVQLLLLQTEPDSDLEDTHACLLKLLQSLQTNNNNNHYTFQHMC